MAKYKIAVTGLLMANNKVKYAGELVDDNELPRSATDLLKEGYIVKAHKADLSEEDQAALEAEKPAGEKAEAKAKALEEAAAKELLEKQELEAQEKAAADAKKAEEDQAALEAEKLAGEKGKGKLDPADILKNKGK